MFYSDRPINTTDEDLLGRSSFANKIARAITSYNKEECLTIGIYGNWGDGKSSLANMILSEIDKIASINIYNEEKPAYTCIIRFNPWLYSNKEDLLSLMFAEISNSFKISDISQTFEKTANIIEGVGKAANIAKYIPIPGFKDIAESIADLFGKYSEALKAVNNKEESLTDLKAKIEDTLSSKNVKLIIAIDDFDRLNQNEIRLMFQVVKMLGDFNNTVYMLMLDKDVVVKSLESVQGGDDYLKKIIQVPISIPPVSKIQLIDILNKEFCNAVGKDTYEEYKDLFNEMASRVILSHIKNIRDIKRIVNLFDFKYSFVKNELNVVDLFALCCTELYNKEYYTKLLEKKQDHKSIFYYGDMEFNKSNYRRIDQKRFYDSYFSLAIPKDPISIDLINKIINIYPSPELEKIFNNEKYELNDLINAISTQCNKISESRLKIFLRLLCNNFDNSIERQVSENTIILLAFKLLDRMTFDDINDLYKKLNYDTQRGFYIIFTNYLLSQEHKHNNMVGINGYDCENKVSSDDLKELESIYRNIVQNFGIFSLDLQNFKIFFNLYRYLDKSNLTELIKNYIFYSKDETALILSCFISFAQPSDSYKINIKGINEYASSSSIYIFINNFFKSTAEKNKEFLEIFSFYYEHQSEYKEIDGIVTIPKENIKLSSKMEQIK